MCSGMLQNTRDVECMYRGFDHNALQQPMRAGVIPSHGVWSAVHEGLQGSAVLMLKTHAAVRTRWPRDGRRGHSPCWMTTRHTR